MTTIPAPKRRRLNATPSALSKPFKSPVRTTPQSQLTSQLSNPSRNLPAPELTPCPKPILSSQPKSALAPPRMPASPQVSLLQKRHTALLTTLAAARASLETHTQALKLETSSTDHELHALTVTWKMAGRAAAEEVFGMVGKRVEAMGGVRAWREKEREKREGGFGGGWGWDAQGESYEEEEGEIEEMEKESDDEENFTMDLMLRSLNIDLNVIGYDKETQKWVN